MDLADEDVDLVRYYTLRGMTHMRRNELEPARDALLRAVQTGDAEAVVYIYLAQVNYQLEDYPATVEALELAGAAVERIPSVYHMKAQCYWLMNEKVAGHCHAGTGLSRYFPATPLSCAARCST